jgi:RNA polymerase sigma-70 factor (ECF subfamily)
MSTDSRSDFELLDAWGNGDPTSGRRLYERYFPIVFRFLRTKIDQGRDDLLQNVWLACLEGRDRIRSRDSFRAYLLQTARFQLYAHYRKRMRDPQLDFSVSSVVGLGQSPTSAIAQQEQERFLLEALRTVPLEQQMVLELSFWEDLTGPEIAEVLCIPETTVRGRLRRATERLREAMRALEAGARLPESDDDLREWARRLRERLSDGDGFGKK